MSANNVWIVEKIGDTWYGWDETAERVVSDKKPKRILSIKSAVAKGKTKDEVLKELGKDYTMYGERMDGFDPEYGVIGATQLPKDGTPIEVSHD